MQNRNTSPPRYALHFLEWFCPRELHEGIEGDLLEQFEIDAKTLGEEKARQVFKWRVLKFFRTEIILRNKFSFQLINVIMLSNYLTIAYRNILKNKAFSAINIIG